MVKTSPTASPFSLVTTFKGSDQLKISGGRKNGKCSLVGSHCGDRCSFVSEFGRHLENHILALLTILHQYNDAADLKKSANS